MFETQRTDNGLRKGPQFSTRLWYFFVCFLFRFEHYGLPTPSHFSVTPCDEEPPLRLFPPSQSNPRSINRRTALQVRYAQNGCRANLRALESREMHRDSKVGIICQVPAFNAPLQRRRSPPRLASHCGLPSRAEGRSSDPVPIFGYGRARHSVRSRGAERRRRRAVAWMNEKTRTTGELPSSPSSLRHASKRQTGAHIQMGGDARRRFSAVWFGKAYNIQLSSSEVTLVVASRPEIYVSARQEVMMMVNFIGAAANFGYNAPYTQGNILSLNTLQ